MLRFQLMRILLLALVGAAAAWAQKVTIEFDQTVDFGRYRTFAIRDGRLNSANPVLNSELIRQRINADIERGLSARGLILATGGPSDLNVRYTFGAVRRAEVEAFPAGWRGFGTEIVRVPFTEGTLVIDLRDPRTRSLVWRGISTEDKSDAAKIEGKLDNMVKKALDKYPPKR